MGVAVGGGVLLLGHHKCAGRKAVAGTSRNEQPLRGGRRLRRGSGLTRTVVVGTAGWLKSIRLRDRGQLIVEFSLLVLGNPSDEEIAKRLT